MFKSLKKIIRYLCPSIKLVKLDHGKGGWCIVESQNGVIVDTRNNFRKISLRSDGTGVVMGTGEILDESKGFKWTPVS